MLILLLALLACGEPVVDGLPEGWAPPEQGGPWLYLELDEPPVAPVELELLITSREGEVMRFPAWLPVGGLPWGEHLVTRSPTAELYPLVEAPSVALDEHTFDAWWWVGVDPVSGETVEPSRAQRQGEARVWVDLTGGDWVLVDGERAWGLRGG